MRELHGVLIVGFLEFPALKRHALLFDRFHLLEFYSAPFEKTMNRFPPELAADVEFLQNRGVLDFVPPDMLQDALDEPVQAPEVDYRGRWHPLEGKYSSGLSASVVGDLFARRIAVKLGGSEFNDTVAICKASLPHSIHYPIRKETQTVLNVAVEALPVPGKGSSWEDILDFKQALHDKHWSFRRFLNMIATKGQSESEVRDEIEWLVNEYRKAMEIFDIKSSNTLVEAYIIPAIEILEDVVKLNWSKIAKGAIAVRKRRIDLMEAEMKAPGRECAYVFDARKRFG